VKRFLINGIIAAVIGVSLCYFVILPVSVAIFVPDDIRLTESEFASKQRIAPARFVRGVYDSVATVDDVTDKYVDLKLFGLVKIKRVKVEILPFEKVIAGGLPIGFSTKVNGAIVLSNALGFKKGDVITSINSESISSIEDLEKQLTLVTDSHLDIGYLRSGVHHFVREHAQPDGRLGLWLKDETTGVGMLTYINPENNNFAALGHRLVDHETGALVDARAGSVYMCNVVGIERGSGQKVGELQSTLKQGSQSVQGSVLSGNARGIFGCLNDDSRVLEICKNNIFDAASRYSARPGRAKILLSLDGENIAEYDVDIIKTRYQKYKQSKGMVIRLTDKKLLAKTGGIIHGMSGSPIIQNGKMIGALTHVMIGDSTKGYGIYLDFILP